jgi:RNA polymerase sigma factor (sigma-70 family)
MAMSGTATMLQHLRRMVLRADGAGMTDGQLLGEFVSSRDAAAFESLLGRHGPMVLGVCRRMLQNTHDAEDAFQATFLVLARKAASVSPAERVGSWLYGVAHTTAVRLRAANARRRARERQVADMPEPQAVRKGPQEDLHRLLDEELARLPEKYRTPIVLCDLEGRARREVARQLGLPEGTLSSRLTTARRMLAKRLTRHGLAVSGGALAMAVSREVASACGPASLVRSTVEAAARAAAGQAATGLISAQVAALTEGVLKAMVLTKLKTVLGVMLVAASLCGAAGLIYQTQAAQQGDAPGTRPKPAGKGHQQKADQTSPPKSDGSLGSIKVRPGPRGYKALFIKTLGVIAEHFEQISYANQYDGRIEAYRMRPLGSRPAVHQHAVVGFETYDDGYLIRVRVSKVVIPEAGPEEVVGRDTRLEQAILEKLNALPAKKDKLPVEEALPDGREHDFGRVKRGTVLEHTFRVVNMSNVPLQLTSVRSSSGCTTGSVERKVLQPGEKGKVKVTVDTGRFLGPKAMMLLLEGTRGQTAERFTFKIKADSVNGQ